MFPQGKTKTLKPKAGGQRESPMARQHEAQQMSVYEEMPIDPSLASMTERLQEELGQSADLIVREFGGSEPSSAKTIAVVYIQAMIDDTRLDEFIIQTMQEDMLSGEEPEKDYVRMKDKLLAIGIVSELKTFKDLFEKLFLGYAIVLMEGQEQGISAHIVGGASRGVDDPKTEMTIRGPREGFTESIRVNSMMVRRKIRSPKLWLEQHKVGEITQTPVAIMYIQGLAGEEIIEDLRDRLQAIKIDGILETNYIEEMISDQKWSPFPTIMYSERPDVVAAALLEGRIALLVDGTPFALILPVSLNAFFQAAEDYYQTFQMATFLRMLRFVSFVIALLMPSVYVAIIGYHQEMIPTQLLLKLAAQREGVPFPAYLEAFLMEFVFEILREAVLRMPSAAGSAVSIVGGLVIGQSVVEAGIVSSAVVIVVSFTAIASFVSPIYNLGIAARLLRFFLLFAASTLGFYGIALVTLVILLHLSNIRSFGVPYLKPFAPFYWKDMKDSLIRVPMWLMKQRPQKAAEDDNIRQSTKLKPRKEPSQ
ncbi:spore germination protein [Paenibacillus soyae]|uniref:Spore germination protein n=1 Tax=Paenibacillus soyae TaxID=2969249 RepID=A0A9X2MW18_9BACL|nr:spore germination protein [Paenibacillus soyae]MCR2807475.1 spore germination protein [Paenibacillus soyae]